MALNFLGLGFSFGAKDKGLKQATKGYSTDFDNLDKSAKKLGDSSKNLGLVSRGVDLIKSAIGKLDGILRQNKLQTWMQALTMGPLKGAADKVRQLGGETLNLTTSLEATVTASNKSAKMIGVNFGLVGKDLGKFTGQATSMSIALNMGVETTSAAIANFKASATEFRAIGIKSASDLAKSLEVLKFDANDLRSALQTMSGTLRMQPDEIKRVTSSWTKMGQETMDVAGAIKDIPTMLKTLEQRAALAGVALTRMQLADFAADTAAYAAGLFKMGKGAAEARQMSMELASKLVESQKNIQNMFSGTSSDFDNFRKELSVVTGNVVSATDLMKKGPAGFAASFAEMTLKMKEAGMPAGNISRALDFIRARLEQAIGPEQATALTNFMATASKESLKSMMAVKKSTVSIGELGKAGFSTGRTLADSFSLAQNQFIMSFRAIARKEAVSFVNDTTKEFGRFTKTLREVSEDKGPLGMIVSKFSEMHQLGVAALLPKTLRPMATVFGTMVKEATPLIAMLGALGLRFTHIFNPITAVIAATVGLIWLFKGMKDRTKESISGMAKSEGARRKESVSIAKLNHTLKTNKNLTVGQAKALQKQILRRKEDLKVATKYSKFFKKGKFVSTKAVESMEKEAADIAKKRTIEDIKGWVKTAAAKVKLFVKALPGILKGVWETLKEVWAELKPGEFAQGLIQRLKQINWRQVFSDGLEALTSLGKWVWDLLASIDWLGILETAWDISAALYHTLMDGVEKAFDWVSKRDFGADVEKLLGGIGKALSKAGDRIGPLVARVFKTLPEMAHRAADLVLRAFKEIPPKIGQVLSKAGPPIEAGIKKVLPKVLDFTWKMLKFFLYSMPKKIMAAIPAILSGLGKLLRGAVDFLTRVVMGALKGIEEWLVKKFPKSAEGIRSTFEKLRSFIGTWVKALKIAFVLIWKSAVTIFKGIVLSVKVAMAVIGAIFKVLLPIWKVVWKGISATVSFTWGILKPIFETIKKVAVAVWEGISGAALYCWESIKIVWNDAVRFFSWVWGSIKAAAKWTWDAISGAAATVGRAVMSVWNAVGNFFGKLWAGIKSAASPVINLIAQGFTWVGKLAMKVFGPVLNIINKLRKRSKTTTGAMAKDLEGFAEGAEDSAKKVNKAEEGMLSGKAAQEAMKKRQAAMEEAADLAWKASLGFERLNKAAETAGAEITKLAEQHEKGIDKVDKGFERTIKRLQAQKAAGKATQEDIDKAIAKYAQQRAASETATQAAINHQKQLQAITQQSGKANWDLFHKSIKGTVAYDQNLIKTGKTTEEVFAAQKTAQVKVNEGFDQMIKKVKSETKDRGKAAQQIADLESKRQLAMVVLNAEYTKVIEQMKGQVATTTKVEAATKTVTQTATTGVQQVQVATATATAAMQEGIEQLKIHSQTIVEELGKVEAGVGTLFGRITTEMGGMKEGITAVANELKAMVETTLAGGIEGAFVWAFGEVRRHTDRFTSDEVKKFSKMTDAIVKHFRAMWIAMLKDTSTATEAIAKDMAGVFTKMQTLLKLTREVEKSKLEAKKAETAPEAKKPSEVLGRAAGYDDLYNAIHEPKWWTEYRDLFQREMGSLALALQGAGGRVRGAGAPGGASAAGARALERQERTGVKTPPPTY